MTWEKVWRDGFAPQFAKEELQVLREGLINDDPLLLQGRTTEPPPLMCVQDWPCNGACAIGYIAMKAKGLTTVGEISEHFTACCYEADRLLGEPAGCRYFLNYFDDTPRKQMREEFIKVL